jgi:hypothetical protein
VRRGDARRDEAQRVVGGQLGHDEPVAHVDAELVTGASTTRARPKSAKDPGTTASFVEPLDPDQIASLLSALDERAVRTSGLRVEEASSFGTSSKPTVIVGTTIHRIASTTTRSGASQVATGTEPCSRRGKR